MALNYETLIRAASKPPEQRTTTEVNDFIFPWLKQSLKKKQGIFQKISDGNSVVLIALIDHRSFCVFDYFFQMSSMIFVKVSC